jgi:hypothetical protein
MDESSAPPNPPPPLGFPPGRLPFARPPNPFALGLSLLPPTDAPTVGEQGSRTFPVSYPNRAWVDKEIDIGDEWACAASLRMRRLDYLRKHAPIEEESRDLNIPDGRLLLDHLKDVMAICGGLVGVRFSTEDFRFLQETTARLSTNIKAAEDTFQALSSGDKKKSNAVIRSIGIADGIDDPCKTPTVPSQGHEALVVFHERADSVIRDLFDLQRFVSDKQGSIDKSGGNIRC